MIKEQIRPTIVSFILLTLVTGVVYPAAVTLVAQIFFKNKAEGSLIYKEGKAVGSELIGQTFSDPKYFWGRLSAAAPAFNGAASSGSNLGPLNPALLDSAHARIKTLRNSDPANSSPIPVDLVAASASGLDPHISLAAAYYQASRVARPRGISEGDVKEIIRNNTQGRFLGLLGEPVVNVLKLNMELDAKKRDLDRR